MCRVTPVAYARTVSTVSNFKSGGTAPFGLGSEKCKQGPDGVHCSLRKIRTGTPTS